MLPKEYISYSAFSLWKRNKEAFRYRYYEGQPSTDTVETLFGKKIATMLEENKDEMKHIPRYAEPEFSIEVMIGGVKVLGYLDSYDPDRHRFLEYKTGHMTWDKLRVLKHDQLVFYSMLIKESTGKVHPWCHLIWMETEFVKKKIMMGNIELEERGRTKTLRLTGKVKKFRRYISKNDRERMKVELLQVVEEIKYDYQSYKANKQVHVGSGQGEPQKVSSA